ncbi:glycosyltransferase [Salinibaculum salinum]|uniref:glycosyltransferase n=1 Tax=Salinibaculum salinum TaxID=3131996 RepID=UPI0030EE95DA
MTSGVSLIIPTYNERRNISGIVAYSLEALEDYDAEIIIVDDDSPDLTWQVAKDLFGDNNRVTVIRRTDESGLATAVTRGFEESTKDYCAVIDADFQHPPEKLPELVDALDNGADIAIGSRYTDDAGVENWPVFRKMISWGALALAKVSVSSAYGISDPISGFFAVRCNILEGVELNPSGYKILLEVLARANYDTVTEIPYTFTGRERGESNLTASEYKAFVKHLLNLRFQDSEATKSTSVTDGGTAGKDAGQTRIAICTHFSIEHFRGGEKWAVNLANHLAEDDAIDVSIHSLPYAPGGKRKVNAEQVIDDPVDYSESWRHDLSNVDTAYVFYHPGAKTLNFPGADRYIAGIHSWLYVSPNIIEDHYGAVPTAVKLLYRTLGESDLAQYDTVHSVTPVFDCDHEDSVFIPNFIDTTLFRPDRSPLNDEFTVLVTSAHIEEKGWDMSKEITARIPDDISVVTTGTADTPHIDGLGVLTEQELADIYSKAHVVLHPARVDTDSMVINEACASGTPVVTTSLISHVRENDAILQGDTTGEMAALIEGILEEYRTDRETYESRCNLARRLAAERSIPTVMTRLKHLLTTGSESIPDVEPTLPERSKPTENDDLQPVVGGVADE